MTWSGVDGGLLAWESFSAWRVRAVGMRVMLPQALCCTRVSALHALSCSHRAPQSHTCTTARLRFRVGTRPKGRPGRPLCENCVCLNRFI